MFASRCILYGSTLFLVLMTSTLKSQEILRWKLSKGQKFKVVIDHDCKSSIETPAGEKDISFHLITTNTWEVIESEDGKHKVRRTVDRVQATWTFPFAGTFKYDSKNPDKNENLKRAGPSLVPYKSMVGRKTVSEFDGRGKRIKTKKNKYVGISQSLAIYAQIADQLIFELPEGAAKKGDSWPQKFQDSLPPDGFVQFDNKYTVSDAGGSKESKTYQIKVAGTYKKEFVMQNVTGKSDDGKFAGTFYFDPATGHLSKAALTHQFVDEIDLGGRQKINQSYNSKINILIEPIDK